MAKKSSILPLIVTTLLLLVIRFIGPIQPWVNWTVTTTRLSNASLIIIGAVLASDLITRFVADRKLRNLAHSVTWVGALILIFFAYHDKLIAVGISLGIIAAIFGFVFQAPLLSIAAYVYIKASNVYRRGDRIRVGELKGEVMSVSPIRTEILEVGGEYLSADLPSGRIFKFPNSVVLQQPVSNYTHELPYIWVDLPFHLGYTSDFDFIIKKIDAHLKKKLKKTMPDVQDHFDRIIRQHYIKVPFPGINYNLIADRGWMTLRVIFPVDPREQAKVTTDITKDILNILKKHKRKVRLPRGMTQK